MRGDGITWGERTWSHEGGELGDGRPLAQSQSLAVDVLALSIIPRIQCRNRRDIPAMTINAMRRRNDRILLKISKQVLLGSIIFYLETD